jgi:hypothetical protein
MHMRTSTTRRRRSPRTPGGVRFLNRLDTLGVASLHPGLMSQHAQGVQGNKPGVSERSESPLVSTHLKAPHPARGARISSIFSRQCNHHV